MRIKGAFYTVAAALLDAVRTIAELLAFTILALLGMSARVLAKALRTGGIKMTNTAFKLARRLGTKAE